MNTAPQIPPHLAAAPRSGIRAVMERAWEIGEPITHLEVGEPDFPTPPHIIEAMAQAAFDGATGYGSSSGLPELREACAAKLAAYNGIAVTPAQVLITAGGMQGVYATVMSLLSADDEVLIPEPGWPNYRLALQLAHGRVVPYALHSGAGFQPDLAEIEQLLTKRTRMIIVNSPSNPLGCIWSPETVAAVVELAASRGIWVLSDECYDQIAFDGAPLSPASLDGSSELVISVHSFSKTYAMTGFRLGYVSGPSEAMGVLTKMLEAQVLCVSTPAQHAGLAALRGPQDCVSEMVEQYRQRRDAAVGLATAAGLSPSEPAGAFYLWVELPTGVEDSTAFAERLITEHRVAVAPGATFGEPDRPALRLSLAADSESIVNGIGAIGDLLASG